MWSMLTIIKPALMFILCLTQDYHVIYMCLDIIFQILPPCFRLMISHHVICHVTAVSHVSSSSRKEKKSKIDMKSEK